MESFNLSTNWGFENSKIFCSAPSPIYFVLSISLTQRPWASINSIKIFASCFLRSFVYSDSEIAFFFPLRWWLIAWIISPFLTDPFPEMIFCNSCLIDIYTKLQYFYDYVNKQDSAYESAFLYHIKKRRAFALLFFILEKYISLLLSLRFHQSVQLSIIIDLRLRRAKFVSSIQADVNAAFFHLSKN